jgi:ATP-dependent Clp protease protease subunit
MSKFWNFIKNAASGTTPESVELRIDGDIISDDDAWIYEWFGIAATSPNAFKDELSQYKGKDITVWIDSYGGDVFAAAGIYNALKEHNGKVTVKIDGKAMSAASVIAMAGDEILMSPVSVMMIHNPLSAVQGYAADMRKQADVLDEVKKSIMNAYQLKTKKSSNQISAMMDDESYMSANSAVKQGFADGILYQDNADDPKNVMNFSFDRFAIQNSASVAAKRYFDFENAHKPKPAKDEKENDELLKAKLALEIEL